MKKPPKIGDPFFDENESAARVLHDYISETVTRLTDQFGLNIDHPTRRAFSGLHERTADVEWTFRLCGKTGEINQIVETVQELRVCLYDAAIAVLSPIDTTLETPPALAAIAASIASRRDSLKPVNNYPSPEQVEGYSESDLLNWDQFIWEENIPPVQAREEIHDWKAQLEQLSTSALNHPFVNDASLVLNTISVILQPK